MTKRVLATAVLGTILGACSTTGPHSPAGEFAASGGAQSAGDAAGPLADLDKRAREMGYRVESRNGEKAYCRNSAPTASHISRQDCLNSAGLLQLVRNAEKSQDELSRRQEQGYAGGPRIIN
jgi:hypothetical protein